MTEKEFESFFHENFDRIRSYLFYRSGNMELSTDLAQDTLLRIWEKQVKFEEKKTVGLAYKIAGDLFVDQFRKGNSKANYLNSLDFEFNSISPEKELMFKELKTKYEQGLAKLSENQRVVFLMSRFEGLKYAEIAEKLNISVKAVEKRMSGALATFKDILKILYYLLFFQLLQLV